MLVIKIEMWPGGRESKAKEIGRMLIHNTSWTGKGAKRGDYAIRLMRKGSPKTVSKTAEVLDYPRLSYPVWKLVRRALEALNV